MPTSPCTQLGDPSLYSPATCFTPCGKKASGFWRGPAWHLEGPRSPGTRGGDMVIETILTEEELGAVYLGFTS